MCSPPPDGVHVQAGTIRPGTPFSLVDIAGETEGRMDLFAKVQDIIVRDVGTPKGQITRGVSFRADLSFDSRDAVDLLMALEDEYDIEIPEDDTEGIETVGDLVEYLEKTGVSS